MQEELPPLTKEAVAKVVEYASKVADNQEKLSTRFNDLAQIIGEAATWARIGRSKLVTAEYVDKALRERVNRVKKYDSRYMEMIKENTLLIDTDGFVTGQINGLTVMNVGEYSFGKPVKITANTYTGKSGIINIEREVELSGSSHSKGVLILTGYLGQMFAQDIPLSLTASVCFEQLYNVTTQRKRGCLKIELRWPLLFHLQLKSFGFFSKKEFINLLLKVSSFQTFFFVAISPLRGYFCKIMCNGQQAELNFNLLKPTKMEPLEVLVVLEVSKYGFHILRSLAAIFQAFIREQFFTFPFLDFPQTMVYLHNSFRPASVTPAS